jgi:hypothetical protein
MTLRSGRQPSLLAAALLLAASGCSGVDAELGRSWEISLRDMIVSGSTDFRAESDGSEDGVFVMSYRPPPGPVPLERFSRYVQSRDRCLRVVGASATEALLRCDHHRALPSRPMEVRAAIGPSGRLFVLYAQDAPHSGYVLTFQQIAARSTD